jgi:phosphatidylglycerophosphate synthase
MVDWEKAEKLPPDKRYFNISVLWIFYYRSVLKLLYYFRIPHEIVTILSISFGFVSAAMFYNHRFVLAAIALHLKDVFDACDGALARLTGRGHLIGRYLDSVGDFLSLTLVILAIAFSAGHTVATAAMIAVATILSLFIQCSFFNYYQLAYLKIHGIDRLLSEMDEASRRDKFDTSNNAAFRATLGILRFSYLVIYGWQDKLVAVIDSSILRVSGASERTWYGDKALMAPQSALCFGTHIVIIIVCALLGHPEYALWVILTAMNIFLVSLLLIRRYGGRLRQS